VHYKGRFSQTPLRMAPQMLTTERKEYQHAHYKPP